MHWSLGTIRTGNRDAGILGSVSIDVRSFCGCNLENAKSFDDVPCGDEDTFTYMKGAPDSVDPIEVIHSNVGHCAAEFLEDGSCLLRVQGSCILHRSAVVSNRHGNATIWWRFPNHNTGRLDA